MSRVQTEGNVGEVNGAVAYFVHRSEAQPKATVQLTPAAPKKSMKAFARELETQLGTGGCAPAQAERIENAIS